MDWAGGGLGSRTCFELQKDWEELSSLKRMGCSTMYWAGGGLRSRTCFKLQKDWEEWSGPLNSVVCEVDGPTGRKLDLERDGQQSCLVPQSQYYWE